MAELEERENPDRQQSRRRCFAFAATTVLVIASWIATAFLISAQNKPWSTYSQWAKIANPWLFLASVILIVCSIWRLAMPIRGTRAFRTAAIGVIALVAWFVSILVLARPAPRTGFTGLLLRIWGNLFLPAIVLFIYSLLSAARPTIELVAGGGSRVIRRFAGRSTRLRRLGDSLPPPVITFFEGAEKGYEEGPKRALLGQTIIFVIITMLVLLLALLPLHWRPLFE